MNVVVGRAMRAIALGSGLLLAHGAAIVGQPGIAPIAVAASQSPSTLSPQATPPSGSTLSAVPSIVSATTRPGGASTSKVTLKAGIALDVEIVPVGLGQSLDGTFASLADAQDTSPYTARGFVDVTPRSLQLKAGDSRDLTVSIHVPNDAGDGTRYAILQVRSRPAGSAGNVGIGLTLGISVVVTIDGTAQTHTGKLENLVIDSSAPGDPLAVSATLMNTGNAHYGAPPNAISVSASLLGASGTIATTKTDITGNSIVPTFGRRLDLSLKPPAAFVDGTYELVVEADLQNGTMLDRATLQFKEHNGSVLGVTSAPNPPAPAPGTGGTDGLALIVASVIGAGVAVLLLTLLRPRRRRPPVTPPPAG